MSSNNQINAIKAALAEMELSVTDEAVRSVVKLMQSKNLSVENAVLTYVETQSQQGTQRVNYQGKTQDGYTDFAAQKSVQQRFALANELSAIEAEELLEDAAMLTAKRVQQDKASGKFSQRVAGHLVLGRDAESVAKDMLMAQVEGHFAAQEIDTDFFTNALSGSPSTLLLGAAK